MTDTTTRGPLNQYDVLALAQLVTAAHTGAQVARLLDTGAVAQGTARSIGDQVGHFAGPRDDIRDLWLRVTLTTGWEAFWPVAELLAEVGSGEFIFPTPRGV